MIYFPFGFAQMDSCLKNFEPLRVALLCLFLFFPTCYVSAQSDIENLASKEIVKRTSAAKQSSEWINKARRAWGDKNLEEAYKNYLAALDLLPPSPATADQRKMVMPSFCNLSMEYANYLVGRGRFEDAVSVAKTLLLPDFSPNFTPAAKLISNLEQTSTYNRTITPKFADKRDAVSTLLNQAEGFFNTSRYDLSLKRYEEVLSKDPYNRVAREGMDKILKERASYNESSYNETRSRLLWLADRQWERPVRKELAVERNTFSERQASGTKKDAIMRKLNDTIIDKFEITDVTLQSAVEHLMRKSRDLDRSSENLDKKGVNIVLQLKPNTTPSQPNTDTASPAADQTTSPVVTPDSKISLSLNNVPLINVIRYLAQVAGLNYRIEPFAIALVPLEENTDELMIKKFRVTPTFIPSKPVKDSGPLAGTASSVNSKSAPNEKDARQFFESQGVQFPMNSYAKYLPSLNILIVRNTQYSLNLIESLIDEDMSQTPTQVEVESKFVEISQNNMDELGFDWLLGPLVIGSGVRGNGGARPYSQAVRDANNQYDDNDYYNNFPSSTVGQNPVTAGNRSGRGSTRNQAITSNGLDDLLANASSNPDSAAPGILGLSGVFSNAQFQMVIRAINQKKGVDLMSSPKIITKSGSTATIKMVRDFPYPNSFLPPKVAEPPSGGNVLLAEGANMIRQISAPVMPSLPQDFVKREIGIILEVTPQIGSDNYTLDLELKPQVCEFDGFINYGSPIIAPSFDNRLIRPVVIVPSGITTTSITDNVINQPIFSLREVTTTVNVWDGQTVALGGLIREDIQKVNDKVPILGDIPLAGRLFRSNVEQKIKRNLIIFVTARILDTQGKPLKQESFEDDVVAPLGNPVDLPQPTVLTKTSDQ